MSKEPVRNKYVGHRYVPKVMGEWDKKETYEGLSIVTNKGASYTSKKRVPVGIDISDEDYWVITGNYDAQIEEYRKDVRRFDGRINENKNGITSLNTDLTENKKETTKEFTKTNNEIEKTNTNVLQNKNNIIKNDHIVDIYVSPKNFESLDDCLSYAYDNNKYVKADTIVLTKHANFRGIGLEIDFIDLNGFSMELGSYNTKTVGETPSKYENGKHPTQTVKKIMGEHNNREKLFIRGSAYQTINIDSFNGYIEFRMNDKDHGRNRFNSYSTYNFGDIRGIDIQEDPGSGETDPEAVLWASENIFNLRSCFSFTIGRKGQYHHNMNQIYGGTFESGSGKIHILTGQSNRFHDIRAEGGIDVIFGEETRFNKVFNSHYVYTPTVTDKGYGNAVITVTEENNRLVHYDYLSKVVIPSGKLGTGELIKIPFRNLSLNNETGDAFFEKNSHEEAGDIFYETPFLRDPKNIRFLVTGSLKKGNGFSVGYKFYDENHNDITLDVDTVGYHLTTSQSHIGLPGGASRGPSKGLNMYMNHVSSEEVTRKSDILNWIPAPNWVSSSRSSKFRNVKYVKFFVGQTESSGDLQFYDLNIAVYNISGNYHTEYEYNYF